MDELERLLDSDHYVCITKEYWEKIVLDLETLGILLNHLSVRRVDGEYRLYIFKKLTEISNYRDYKKVIDTINRYRSFEKQLEEELKK